MMTSPRVTRAVTRAAALLLCAAVTASSASLLASALEPSGNGVKIRNWVTNDPNYSFSDQYKTSVWFQNFDELELTENQRSNVLRIALSQLGYHEGNSQKDMNGMNRDGHDNYIEYARLIVPHYNDNHYEWCACFVNWCLNQAGIDYAYGEIGCWKWVEWLKAHKMFQNSAAYRGKYVPQPADMIFFNWDENNTTSGHIGYVLYADDKNVYTIEGNSSDAVSLNVYALNAKCIIGYGTPPYNEGSEATIDWSYADGRPTGQYVCKSTGAYIRETPDIKGKRLAKTVIGHTATLLSVEGEYGYVLYEGTYGYVQLSDVILLTPMHVARFEADGQAVGSVAFKKGQTTVEAPEVPAKEHYTGAWAAYRLGDADVTVKAVYTPIPYTITFVVDGETLATATYTAENAANWRTLAPVPTDGTFFEWEELPASLGNVTLHGQRTTVPPETQPAGESVPENAESGTAQLSDTQDAPGEGCASSLSAMPLLLALTAGAALTRKKKTD